MCATDKEELTLLRCFCAELSFGGKEGAEVAGKLDKGGLREAAMNALKLAEILLRVEDHEHVDPEENNVLIVLARRRLYLGLSPNVIFDFLIGLEEVVRWRIFALGRAEHIRERMRQSSRACLQYAIEICSLLWKYRKDMVDGFEVPNTGVSVKSHIADESSYAASDSCSMLSAELTRSSASPIFCLLAALPSSCIS